MFLSNSYTCLKQQQELPSVKLVVLLIYNIPISLNGPRLTIDMKLVCMADS